jgi:hypothetical protein
MRRFSSIRLHEFPPEPFGRPQIVRRSWCSGQSIRIRQVQCRPSADIATSSPAAASGRRECNMTPRLAMTSACGIARVPRQTTPRKRHAMEWVHVTPDVPYFQLESGVPWTPVGQNDAITWPDLAGLFGRRDRRTAELPPHAVPSRGDVPAPHAGIFRN